MPKPTASDWSKFVLDPWLITLVEIERGEFPTMDNLARALRSDAPVPASVRNFLADYVEGKIKRPKGRPAADWLSRGVEVEAAKAIYNFELKNIQNDWVAVQDGKPVDDYVPGTPSEVAIVRTAAQLSTPSREVSEETVRKLVFGTGRRA